MKNHADWIATIPLPLKDRFSSYRSFGADWLMAYGERCALVGLLQSVGPQVAIEIGTGNGGSTIALSQFAEKVYSIDIARNYSADLRRNLTNVEFITGSSRETLPALLGTLEEKGKAAEFILIDGDHSAEGVKADIENVLRFQPTKPLFILMHDSFNPDVRRGIKEADWCASAYMHSLDLDLVPGQLWENHEMWGGFALAIMLPTARQGDLEVRACNEPQFHLTLTSRVVSGEKVY